MYCCLQEQLPGFEQILMSPRSLSIFVIHLFNSSQHRLLREWSRTSTKEEAAQDRFQTEKLLREVHWPAFKRTSLYEEAVNNYFRDSNERSSVSMMKALSEHPETSGMMLYNLKGKDLTPQPAQISNRVLEGVAICESRLQGDGSWSFSLVQSWPSNTVEKFSGVEKFCFPIRIGECDSFGEAVCAGPPRMFNAVLTSSSGMRCRAACLQLPHLHTDNAATLAVCVFSSLDASQFATASLRQLLKPLVELKGDIDLFECEHMKWLQRLTEMSVKDSNGVLGQAIQIDTDLRQYQLPVLFRLLHPLRIMELLEVILLEQKLLLISSQLSVRIQFKEQI
jgi:hypothetical protein